MKQQLATLGVEFDTLRDILQPRLDLLIEKFGDRMTATPKLTQPTRETLLEFHSEVARIRMRAEEPFFGVVTIPFFSLVYSRFEALPGNSV